MTTLTIGAGGAVRLPGGASGTRHAVRASSAPYLTTRGPLHLTARGRLVVVLVALVLLLTGALAATRADAQAPTSAPQVERYVVAPGDTLWGIASGVARPGADLREVVREIEMMNGMASATLTAGQQILLPWSG